MVKLIELIKTSLGDLQRWSEANEIIQYYGNKNKEYIGLETKSCRILPLT